MPLTLNLGTTGDAPPATGGATAGAPAGATAIKLPFNFGLALGNASNASTREQRVLRAVAGGAAIRMPAEAMHLVKQARDNPSSVVNPAIDETLLLPLLAAVDRRSTDRAGAPAASDIHTAVAATLGVDAVLVATADAALADRNDIASEALQWVAAIEPTLLEKAAITSARRRQLDRLPDPVGQSTVNQLAQLEARLREVEKQLPPPATSRPISSTTAQYAGRTSGPAAVQQPSTSDGAAATTTARGD
jgi:hypothetical protein